jgi:hypothetical protein
MEALKQSMRKVHERKAATGRRKAQKNNRSLMDRAKS